MKARKRWNIIDAHVFIGHGRSCTSIAFFRKTNIAAMQSLYLSLGPLFIMFLVINNTLSTA